MAKFKWKQQRDSVVLERETPETGRLSALVYAEETVVGDVPVLEVTVRVPQQFVGVGAGVFLARIEQTLLATLGDRLQIEERVSGEEGFPLFRRCGVPEL